jgi:hypothetical protein
VAELANFDAFELRLAADAWCEVRNAIERTGGDAAAQSRAEEATFEWLERAVERGYSDRDELESTPALEPLRAAPRFAALLARLPVRPR